MIWLYSFLSVGIISLISLIGVFSLSLSAEKIKKISLFMISFAVGGLLGDALIHLLPEAFAKIQPSFLASLFVIGGILAFFILEKFLQWRHCHDLECPEHTKPMAAISLVGDAVHNFIDGLLVAASFMVSFQIGLTTTLAVIFHEIPQEIGNFGILIHSGYSAKKALLFNFLTALTAFLGAILALVAGSKIENLSLFLLPLAAGGFIYLAGSDLLPELHRDNRLKTSLGQLILIMLGIGIMTFLVFID